LNRKDAPDLKAKGANITQASAAIGHSPSLLAQLAVIELKLQKTDDQLSSLNQPWELSASLEDLQRFFCEKALELRTVLRADVDIARQALAKHIEKLVLTPKETPEGPVFEVSCDVEIFDGNHPERVRCVAVMVARDGVEPQTPAFSVPSLTQLKTTRKTANYDECLVRTYKTCFSGNESGLEVKQIKWPSARPVRTAQITTVLV
jgi:hypothetical protein